MRYYDDDGYRPNRSSSLLDLLYLGVLIFLAYQLIRLVWRILKSIFQGVYDLCIDHEKNS